MVRVLCYLVRMTEHAQSKPNRAIGSGISFRPDLWERLEAEAAAMERPNRSLVVERALIRYFGLDEQKSAREPEQIEGAA